MSKWKKTKKKEAANNVDFEYIVGQVNPGLADVTISGVCDFGEQDGGYFFDEKGKTYFETEEEAHAYLDFIEDEPSLGGKLIEEHDLAEIEEVEEVYRLPFKLVKNKYAFFESEGEENVTFETSKRKAEKAMTKAKDILEANLKGKKGFVKKAIEGKLETLEDLELEALEDVFEVACSTRKMDDEYEIGVWVDCTENEVEYIEGDEDSVRPYRIPLYRPFKTKDMEKAIVKGLRLNTDNKTGLFSGKSLVALLEACGLEEVIEANHENEGDLSLLAGSCFQTEIKVKDSYVSTKGRLPVADPDSVTPLPYEPMVVSFEDEPEDIAEALTKFYLQAAFKDKIRDAKNFKGSNMEKAFAIMEGDTPESSEEPVEDDKGDPVGQDQEEAKEAPAKAEKKEKAAKKPTKAKKAPKEDKTVKKEEPVDDEAEEDLPF